MSVVAVGAAINMLTAGTADWWWWLVLGGGSVVGVVAGVWTTLGAMRGGGDTAETPIKSDGHGPAAAPGTAPTISITADDSSAAAWQIGDYQDTPVVDRVLVVIEQSGTGEVRQLAAVARFIRTLNERAAPLIRVLEQAASTDPALHELRTWLIDAIRADSAVATAKYWRTALRPGLSEDEAADTVATVISPHVYSMLTADMGWSPDAYQQWLAHALPQLLLRPELVST